MSERKLRRIFKERYQITIKEFIAYKRIVLARNLLYLVNFISSRLQNGWVA